MPNFPLESNFGTLSTIMLLSVRLPPESPNFLSSFHRISYSKRKKILKIIFHISGTSSFPRCPSIPLEINHVHSTIQLLSLLDQLPPILFSSSSSSSLFQSQRSLKSQLNRKQSMLTIISTGNREEAK